MAGGSSDTGEDSTLSCSRCAKPANLHSKRGSKSGRRVISIPASSGKWSGKWTCEYIVSLKDLQLEDLTEDGRKDTKVYITLSLHKYREPGVLQWRGFTLQEFANQCFGFIGDDRKGRQIPVHYGSKKHNFFTISSPIATQLPQAAVAALLILLKPNCMFKYKIAASDAHRAWMKCPEQLENCSTGFAFSFQTEDAQNINTHIVLSAHLAWRMDRLRDVEAFRRATHNNIIPVQLIDLGRLDSLCH